MSVRTIAILTTFCLSTLPAMSDESAKEINMNTAQSQTALRTRTRATAKIIVQNSEAKPYDQTVSPALVEMRLSETFTGDIDGESPVRALQVLRDDRSACLVSVQRFHGKLADARAPSCFKVQKPSRTERSLRHGLLFPGRGPVVFPGCAARAVLKATLEKGPKEHWIIGSNDVVTFWTLDLGSVSGFSYRSSNGEII